MPADMQDRINVIAEIDAIGFGGAALANSDNCVVVSMGTGTAIVHFSNNSAKHVGGSGVGGGTIKGFGSLICSLEDPLQLNAPAMQGSASNLRIWSGNYTRQNFFIRLIPAMRPYTARP
ncbi:MAG: hypothetical protein GY850_31020 [bacterium]|nr:hypothetical protein [bacterium]